MPVDWPASRARPHCSTRHGYVEVRRLSEMRVEFDGPPEPAAAPQDIEIRTLSAGEEAAVYACMHEAFIDHWGEGFPSERDWIHDHVTGRTDFDPEPVEAGVAGLAACRRAHRGSAG